MADLSESGAEGVSLFPMFNILACTLGVMVFVLATVATVSLGADKAVEFVGGGLASDPDSEPIWAEWDGRELVFLPSRASVEFDRDLASIATFEQTYDYMFERLSSSPAGAELADASLDRETRHLVLLVRPSGFRTLGEIRGYLDLLGIRAVTEPIEQAWRRVQVR